MQRLTSTRRRKVASITAGLFLLCVASAFGYYLLTFTGAGGGSAKLGESGGSAVLTLTAKLPAGLKPGESGTVTYAASNPTSQEATIRRLFVSSPTVDATHASAGCQDAWFELKNPDGTLAPLEIGGALAVPGGGTPVALGSDTLSFLEKPENQSACSGATITIALSSI